MSSKLAEFKNQDSDRAKVEKWLDSINEHDPACRAEVIQHCKDDLDARKYYLSRYQQYCACATS